MTFQSLYLRKRINFTPEFYEITNRYNTLKSRKKEAHTGLIVLGCHADLFISRLTYNIFLFSYEIFRFFPVFFTLFFVPRVLFHIFHLGKLLLALDTLAVIPVNLNFFLISVRAIVLRFFGSYQLISLLNLTNPATTVLYLSSLAIRFSCDNTMAFLSFRLIASYVHFLILFDHGTMFVEDWQHLTRI